MSMIKNKCNEFVFRLFGIFIVEIREHKSCDSRQLMLCLQDNLLAHCSNAIVCTRVLQASDTISDRGDDSGDQRE